MVARPIPADSVGIGLRGDHCEYVAVNKPSVDWFEVHSENYFGQGGAPHDWLRQIRRDYSLSFHGVGLSLGSTDDLNVKHLERLKELIDNLRARSGVRTLVMEFNRWNLPSRPSAITIHKRNCFTSRRAASSSVQDILGRTILVENASTYLEFSHSEMSEWEFINEITRLSGCRIIT